MRKDEDGEQMKLFSGDELWTKKINTQHKILGLLLEGGEKRIMPYYEEF